MDFTHAELVKRAEHWLMKTVGCSFCLTELTTSAGEIPDAIGWKNGRSILIECKATRADFLSDKKKVSGETQSLEWVNIGFSSALRC